MNTAPKGILIEVEGLDGSYKSTTVDKLATRLTAEYPDRNVIVVRQPGGTPIAEALRNIIKCPKSICENEHLFDNSELHLALASRTQLYMHVILPALSRGSIVISDRGHMSTIAYQSYAGLSRDYIAESIMREPWFRRLDLLVVIDTPWQVCKTRINERYEEDGLNPPDALEERLEHCENVYKRQEVSGLTKELLGIPYDEATSSSDNYAELIAQQVSKLL